MSPAEIAAGRGFVTVRGPLSGHETRLVCDRLRAQLASGTPGVSCRVEAPVDLSVIDLLGRLQLLTRRHVAWLEVCAAGDDLAALEELLTLTGLGCLEPRRQTEAGEQCRVEKVVDVDDLPG